MGEATHAGPVDPAAKVGRNTVTHVLAQSTRDSGVEGAQSPGTEFAGAPPTRIARYYMC